MRNLRYIPLYVSKVFINIVVSGMYMKILWVTKLTDQDPFRSTQLGMSEALRKRGHEITLIITKHFTEKKSPQKDILIFVI